MKKSFRSQKLEVHGGIPSMSVLLAIGAVLACVASALATDTVAPQQVSLTHLRDEATANASPVTFWTGNSLLLTNCVCYAGTTNGSAVQGLDGVSVTIKVGNTDSAATYTGTVQNASAGTYWANVTVPTNGSVYIQTTLTDSATNTYTYAWKALGVKSKL